MKPSAILNEVVRSIGEFLFPPTCPGCFSAIDSDHILCIRCTGTIEATAFSYSASSRNLTGIDRVSILLPYDELTRNLIHALKYHGIASLGDPLGRLMARMLMYRLDEPLPSDTLIVPVPLHVAKLKDRGYNQSKCLADGFAAFSGLTVAGDIIARTRDTGTQTALDAGGRAQNVSGAFIFTDTTSLAGQPVIIIDDVLTTGSTVIECARALKAGGAGKVTVCTVASPKVGMD